MFRILFFVRSLFYFLFFVRSLFYILFSVLFKNRDCVLICDLSVDRL